MLITFDVDIDAKGNINALHQIDTAQASVQATLTAIKGGGAALIAAGYAQNTKHPAYAGKTRLDAIKGEIVRLNDAAARTILGV